jgi:hypothetical protein
MLQPYMALDSKLGSIFREPTLLVDVQLIDAVLSEIPEASLPPELRFAHTHYYQRAPHAGYGIHCSLCVSLVVSCRVVGRVVSCRVVSLVVLMCCDGCRSERVASAAVVVPASAIRAPAGSLRALAAAAAPVSALRSALGPRAPAQVRLLPHAQLPVARAVRRRRPAGRPECLARAGARHRPPAHPLLQALRLLVDAVRRRRISRRTWRRARRPRRSRRAARCASSSTRGNDC